MFATRTIPSGTRIVCEAELFTLPEDANIFDVYRAVTACSPEAQREYYNLAACSHKNDMDWGSELRTSYTGPDTTSYRPYLAEISDRTIRRLPGGVREPRAGIADLRNQSLHCPLTQRVTR